MAVDILDMSKKGAKITKLSTVSFSFALGIILLMQATLVTSLGFIGYQGAKKFFVKLEAGFYQRGKDLVLSVSSSSSLAYRTKGFNKLINAFASIVNNDDAINTEKAVSEVFLLDKSGTILAHSDEALVTKNSEDPVSEIALRYNNELFHSALLIDEGQIAPNQFPYSTTNIRSKASYLLQLILPKNLDYSMDFATPVFHEGKPVATTHVVMNRKFMYQFLVSLLDNFLILTAITLAAGLLISFILIFAFALRGRYLQRVWANLQKAELENSLIWQGVQSLEEKVRHLNARPISEKPKLKANDKKKEEVEEIQDAILIENGA